MDLKSKVFGTLNMAKTHWKTPPSGRYMNYREIFAYSVGGIGVYFIFTMATNIMLSTTNVIIGNTIGISPMNMYAMYILAVIVNIPLTGIRAAIIDGVRSKKGKYHPYLLATGVPTALLSCGFVFVPYENIQSYSLKIVIILLFNIALQFFYNFFYEAYENLIFVLSPNTIERSDVITVKSVTYSLAPSIMNPLIPFIAKFVSNGDIYNLNVYRWLYLPVAVFGIAFTTLVYVWTEEKVIEAKSHVIRVSFLDSLKAVAKNKYFWIISLASWIGFLETSWGAIHSWLYQYDKTQNVSPEVYSLMVIIISNSSLWGMLITPVLIRKMGKRNVMILSNILNIVFIACLYAFVHNIWLVVLCIWLNYFVGAFNVVLNPAIQADIRDYQHYITGERIDGMFASVGLIGSIITLATSGVLPFVYEKYGIFKGNGYGNMYDVLYDPEVLFTLLRVLIVLGIVGATLNVIPFFFYDLTEKKQKGMVNVLKIRAFFEDYSRGISSSEALKETVELIRQSREMTSADYTKVDKSVIANARKTKNKQIIKKAKEDYKNSKKFEEDIFSAKILMDEIEKFSNPLTMKTVEQAKAIVDEGLQGVYGFTSQMLKDAIKLPASTQEEKTYRKYEIEFAKTCLYSKKCALRYFKDEIIPFDNTQFNELFEKEDEIEKLIFAKVKSQNSKDSNLKAEIKELRKQKSEIEKKVKILTKESRNYNRSAKFYAKAQRLVAQYESYSKLNEIEKLYEGELTVISGH